MSEAVTYNFGEEWRRTHRCGELRGKDTGEGVVLAGWVKKVRELGGLIFLDLWDRSGTVQLVIQQERVELHKLFRSLRSEDVLVCSGTVRSRPQDMINRGMKTGEIEVAVEKAAVLNRSKVPPFTVTSEVRANEDLRLRYRYLDLRREPLQRNMELRHRLSLAVREFLSKEGFLEIETPMLVRRTPEGARDFLVPSRLQPGKFYALPQSPQLYKQILMVAGFDRYFQLARCLRDEDLRADRQPEHTQVDIEMSFVSEGDVFDITERLMKQIFSDVAGVNLDVPFPRVKFRDAMDSYGTDKPDTRYGLEIHDCGEVFDSGDFRVFSSVLKGGGVVKGVSFAGGASYSRRRIKELEELARRLGAGGLVAVKVDRSEVSSSVSQYLTEDRTERLLSIFGVKGPSLLLLIGGEETVVARVLGEIRDILGKECLPEGKREFKFLWVNRFPLFVASEGGGWEPSHHIFSMPLEEDLHLLQSDPGNVRGHLYDLVCNGTELGSGSIRVHHKKLQEELFEIIGVDSRSARHKFGFLLDSFEYGAPPHGGIALGLDRIAMLMGGGASIRDYIAFPKTQSAASLMEGAPSEVEDKLLRELHIKVTKGNDKEQ